MMKLRQAYEAILQKNVALQQEARTEEVRAAIEAIDAECAKLRARLVAGEPEDTPIEGYDEFAPVPVKSAKKNSSKSAKTSKRRK